jgi:hypothetical protein
MLDPLKDDEWEATYRCTGCEATEKRFTRGDRPPQCRRLAVELWEGSDRQRSRWAGGADSAAGSSLSPRRATQVAFDRSLRLFDCVEIAVAFRRRLDADRPSETAALVAEDLAADDADH